MLMAIAAALNYPTVAASSSKAALPITLLGGQPHSEISVAGNAVLVRAAHYGESLIATNLDPVLLDALRQAVIAAALGCQLLATSSPTTAPPGDIPPGEHGGTPGAGDGVVPDGTTVFDNQFPGVTHLNHALVGALRQAATDAAREGVEFYVNSGWRSPEYQEQLLQEAVAKYGSEEEAARWVATPATSAHVSGDAVDIGPSSAARWLSEHGADYGLCQIYGNEIWHFELRSEAIDRGCPPMYPDPTYDPRMQQ